MNAFMERVNLIKQRMRDCSTVKELDAVAAEERAFVTGLNPEKLNSSGIVASLRKKPDPGLLMYLHIIWLKKFVKERINQEEVSSR